MVMHPLERKFNHLHQKGEKALLSYMMAGYPDIDSSLKALRILLEEGTDILELGLPFSDPVADGPAIQTAHSVALENGVGLQDTFSISRQLKRDFPDVPILMMTYLNPVFRTGYERFSELAKESGIDGLIVPDLPAEESEELGEVLKDHGLSLVLLASPTTGRERLSLICKMTHHMTYFVSVTGTTGARRELPFNEIEREIKIYREVCQKPVVVGFGVSSGDHSRRISSFADGVVVGSLFVRLAGEGRLEELRQKVREIKEGTKVGSADGEL